MATKMPMPRKLTKFIRCSSKSILPHVRGEEKGGAGETGEEREEEWSVVKAGDTESDTGLLHEAGRMSRQW